jgi:hypothetical protein
VLGREQAHGGIRHRPGDRLPDVLGLALIQDGLMTTTAPMLRFPNHDEHPAILLLKIPPDYSTSGASGSLSGLEWRYVLPAMIERIVTGWTEYCRASAAGAQQPAG